MIYQNGLYLTSPGDDQHGRSYTRWLVEFLKIAGWTIHDEVVGTRWSNYYGSGSASAVTGTDGKTITITSPSYVFSASDNGRYLSLSGFTASAKDGVYRIARFISAAGSDYTLWIEKKMGPHHDGLPASDTADWALWSTEDTYVPTTNDEIVLEGTGKTGANQNQATGTGDSISMAGSVATLTDAGADFQTNDVGKSITISGATNGGNNGTFTIASRISATQITYTNASGVNETSSFSWAITYKFHLWMKIQSSSYSYQPQTIVSPFASWNNGTHAWDDAKYTSGLTGFIGNTSYDANMNRCVVHASADTDCFQGMAYVITDGDTDYRAIFHAIGEIDTFDPDLDPRPVLAWCGMNIFNIATGWGVPVGGDTQNVILRRAQGLAHDESTSVSYRMSGPCTPTDQDENWVSRPRHRINKRSKTATLFTALVEGYTTGYMEYRGKMRYCKLCSTGIPRLDLMGSSDEFIHLGYGLALTDWNGARSWSLFTGGYTR